MILLNAALLRTVELSDNNPYYDKTLSLRWIQCKPSIGLSEKNFVDSQQLFCLWTPQESRTEPDLDFRSTFHRYIYRLGGFNEGFNWPFSREFHWFSATICLWINKDPMTWFWWFFKWMKFGFVFLQKLLKIPPFIQDFDQNSE